MIRYAIGVSISSLLLSACGNNDPIPQIRSDIPSFCAVDLSVPPLENNPQLNKIADGFSFVEGPVWVEQQQAFYFTEMDFDGDISQGPAAQIHQLVLPDQLSVFIPSSGSNGLATDGKSLIAATHDDQGLTQYDLESKERKEILDAVSGKQFNSPNDLTQSRSGNWYFTDPNWQLGERTSETGITGVYLWRTTGEVELLDDALYNPNGVTLSVDEQWLYVGEANGTIQRYQLDENGSVVSKAHFADVSVPDGMAIDCAGNLYATSHDQGRVIVFSPEGKELASLPVAPSTTNVAFGGEDHRTLLITAGDGIYQVRTQIPGYPY